VTTLRGAATHDIGKCRHPAELSAPGSAHEIEGHRLLLAHGVPERPARIHASWTGAGTTFEDHLVSLAECGRPSACPARSSSSWTGSRARRVAADRVPD
jgi:hypothetical protein